jgi:hypothetical protein
MRGMLAALVLLGGNWAYGDGPVVEIVEPKPVAVDAAPLPDIITNSPTVVVEEEPEKPPGPLGPKWDSDEYVLWWLKPMALPNLLIGGRGPGVPLAGQPDSTILIGGETKAQEHSGGRFMVGWAVDACQTIGIEFGYFFLGSRSYTQAIASVGGAGDWNLARPFVSPITGTEHSFRVAEVGLSSGRFEMVASSRVQGAEVNAMSHLWAGGQFRFDGLLGFRFLQVNEGLRIAQRTNEVDNNFYILGFPVDQPPPYRPYVSVIDIVDQIDGHNIFYGGQIGLRADWSHGPVFVETISKVAFGQTNEVVKISGVQVVHNDGVPTSGPTGFYGQPTNSGRFTSSVFAVVPEVTVRTGWQYKHSRWFVGYNFLYLSRLARPGDQIDERLFPPSRNFGLTELRAPTHHPQFRFQQSDFWAQGLVLGAELRY